MTSSIAAHTRAIQLGIAQMSIVAQAAQAKLSSPRQPTTRLEKLLFWNREDIFACHGITPRDVNVVR